MLAPAASLLPTPCGGRLTPSPSPLVTEFKRPDERQSLPGEELAWLALASWGGHPAHLPPAVRGSANVHVCGMWETLLGSISFFFFFFFQRLFIFGTERKSMNGGGAEREGDTESETGSRLRDINPEPDAGSNSRTARS